MNKRVLSFLYRTLVPRVLFLIYRKEEEEKKKLTKTKKKIIIKCFNRLFNGAIFFEIVISNNIRAT